MIPMAQHLEQDANSWDVFVLQRHAGCPTPQSQFQRETEAGSTKAANWGGPEPSPVHVGFALLWHGAPPPLLPIAPAKGTLWFTPQYPLKKWLLVWGDYKHRLGVIPNLLTEAAQLCSLCFPAKLQVGKCF